MYLNVKQKMSQLPPEYQELDLSILRDEFLQSEKTIVVLDDDPTGTQTCYDVTVLTSWQVELITEELRKKPGILFILTNSRSLHEAGAVQLAVEIGNNLKEAGKKSGREMIVISRSDSTLRGHFPAEVDALATALNMQEAVIVLIPAFIEGGRYTIDDVHYIAEKDELVPVSDTPFAKDVVFGYRHANLKEWVEEKTKGRITASEVNSISIEDIRAGGPKAVSEKLASCTEGSVCIINAASYQDLEVIAMGLMMAEKPGKFFLYRTSATIVPIRAGMESGKPFHPKKEPVTCSNGSLVIVGSHVPKTTSQLTWLLANGDYKSIEVNVREILHSEEVSAKVEAIIQQTDEWIAGGNNVVIHTSRGLEVGSDPESSLQINATVSGFLVNIMKGLKVRPKFIVGKGGITSSDIATKGLSAQKALVLGPIIPGVPVWQMDEKSKFPGIIYVVFPGNVGDEKALLEVCKKLEV
ncbi:MAG: hypothetical protein AVDCRST_MAG96-1765 [uncultured Segetibacter sp.]|uniref:Hydroxyacid dehydrogenase n=1 Tax=uncultured Segetibacter sp. TaxID=481133 RepID=A0A6J4SDS2_9BACT|nr:MAG: hypothetical protein AVDCRST_MAG96-1765 [uncultured Segetibacter sp.]